MAWDLGDLTWVLEAQAWEWVWALPAQETWDLADQWAWGAQEWALGE